MKKFLAMILALVMVLSLVACGNDDAAAEDTEDTEVSDTDLENGEDAVVEGEADVDADADADADASVDSNASTGNDTPAAKPQQNGGASSGNDAPAADAPAASGATMGQTLLGAFKGMDMSKGAQAIADELIANPVIEFMGGTVPVEPGFLSGFDAEIHGFKTGVMFAPMIGSIAFVGYIFELEDGADVAAFMDALKTNANPRWNICVEADETLIHNIGNTVFFLMSPNSLGE